MLKAIRITRKFIGYFVLFAMLLTLFCWTGWWQSVKADTSIGNVAAGTFPFAVAVNPVTNKVYVANQNSANVTVIDGTNNSTATVAAGNYDGDGKFDAGVFRPASSTWFIQRSTAGTLIQQFGITGDLPIPNAFVP